MKRGTAFQELVKEIARAFNPNATIQSGEWVDGPDGRRDMDVSIRAEINGRAALLIVECKDYTYGRSRRPVGISEIDAFDSKRTDLRADMAVMASNTGFTLPALTKARRKKVGAIAIMKHGDERAKAIVQHALLFCKIKPATPIQCYLVDEQGKLVVTPGSYDNTLIAGKPIYHWLAWKAYSWPSLRPLEVGPFLMAFRFKKPEFVTYLDKKFLVSAAVINFEWKTEWFRKVVELDAQSAVFDYIKSSLVFTPGKNRLTINNLDFDNGEPCETPSPEEVGYFSTPRRPGEGFRFGFSKYEEVGHVRLNHSDIKSIDALVESEDLDLDRISSESIDNDPRLVQFRNMVKR